METSISMSDAEMKKFVREQEKKVPVAGSADVIIAGGGPAGFGAAIAAARSGINTLLIEKYGFLGGMATAGLVGPFMSCYTGEQKIIRGVVEELIDLLVQSGAAVDPKYVRARTGYSGFVPEEEHHAHVTPFDPELLKYELMEMTLRAGVNLLLHSLVVGIVKNKDQIEGIIVENKSGRQVYLARVFIDATGDGDLAFYAGAPYEKGRPSDGVMQSATMMFRLGGVNFKEVEDYVQKNLDDVYFRSLTRDPKLKNEYIDTRDDILFFFLPRKGEVIVNSTRVLRVNGLDVNDLTRAEIEGRRQVMVLRRFFQKYLPGFSKCFLIDMGAQIGIRETRRILGEYVLKKEDLLNYREFPDRIVRAAYMIDIHNPIGPGFELIPIPEGKSYTIPYRCLLPRTLSNLLVAGRSISATHVAQSAIRIMPISMAVGQAAGVAASIAIKQGKRLRQIDVEGLQLVLRDQNVVL